MKSNDSDTKRTTNRTPRRRFLQLAGASTGLSVLAGCSGGSGDGGGDGGDGGDGGSTPAPETEMDEGGGESTPKEPESIATDLAITHHPLILESVPAQLIADSIGAQNNVEVTGITSFSGGGTTVRGMTTGGIGAGNSALPALVKGYNAGAPIYLVGLIAKTTTIEYQVPPDSDIETIQDVKGGTIACSNPGSSSEASTIASIRAADGITLDDVEIMFAGGLGESLTAMNEGAADVSWNVPPLSISMSSAGKARRVWKARDYEENITTVVLAMGNRVIEEQSELASRLGQSFADAIEFTKNNVEESAALWAQNADLDEAVARQSFEDYPPEELFGISLNEDVCRTTADTMIAQGLIDEQPDWGGLINQDPLPEEYRVDRP